MRRLLMGEMRKLKSKNESFHANQDYYDSLIQPHKIYEKLKIAFSRLASLKRRVKNNRSDKNVFGACKKFCYPIFAHIETKFECTRYCCDELDKLIVDLELKKFYVNLLGDNISKDSFYLNLMNLKFLKTSF